MKLIIDIPEKDYKEIKHNKQIIESENISNTNGIKAQRAIINATPIPNNAKNGDVIKAIFPNNDTVKVMEIRMKGDWWNAPYQKGGKE